jgi:hypothetical protein
VPENKRAQIVILFVLAIVVVLFLTWLGNIIKSGNFEKNLAGGAVFILLFVLMFDYHSLIKKNKAQKKQ